MIESFEVGSTKYNVVRASALQQDEVLSLLTQALVQRFIAGGQAGVPVDEEVIFSMSLAMPFALKQKLDSLLMSNITVSGENHKIDSKHFDGKVMELNRLRAKVIMWNLEGFFTYWAKEYESVIESMKAQESQETE